MPDTANIVAVLSNFTYLLIKDKAEDSYTKLIDITSVPATGGTPEQHDVTTLSSKIQQFINGITKLENFEFGANYTPKNYQTVYDLQQADELRAFRLAIGSEDGKYGSFDWQGRVTVWTDSYESDSPIPMKFVISVENEEGLVFTPPAGA